MNKKINFLLLFAGLAYLPLLANVDSYPVSQDTLSIIVEGELCVDSLLFFVPEAGVELISFDWTVSNGVNSTDSILSLRFDTPGLYALIVEAVGIDSMIYEGSLAFTIEDCDPCEELPALSIDAQGALCIDSILILSTETDPSIVAYEWNVDGDIIGEEPQLSVTFLEEAFRTVFLLTRDTNDCINSASLGLDILNCTPEDCEVRFPNIFTPNGDGRNDRFRALFNCPPRDFEFRIYDRWGDLIYESSQAEQGWEGTEADGKVCPAGVYVWVARYRLSKEENWVTEKGDVTLFR